MQETPIEFHIGGVSKLTRSLLPGVSVPEEIFHV